MSLAAQLRLMVLTDPALLQGRDAVDVCRRAVQGGATMIQIRWKGGSPAATVELARSLAEDVDLLIHDAQYTPAEFAERAHWGHCTSEFAVDVALAAGAAGAHLGWDDLPLAPARAIVPPGFLLGLSVGTAEEAARARGLPADYWSIGPCYATTTKPDAGQPLGPDGFARLVALAPQGVPVIGIGGITAATAGAVRRAGGAGVAVAGAVLGATDPAAAASAVRAAVSL
jgi:thiamine-phosphate pyrophosphorylase